jgi:hypothetical protein
MAFAACRGSGEPPLGPSANRAPEIRGITLSPAVVPPRGSARVTVDAVDPDGDRLFYRFSAETGTVTADPEAPGQATYTHAGGAGGNDRLTVTVTDTRNTSVSATRSVALQGNRGPTVEVTRFTDTCHPPCRITYTAEASDPDGGPLLYLWSGCASGAGPTAACQVAYPGIVTSSVTVTDEDGGSTTVTVQAEGTNRRPTVRGVQDAPTGEPRLLVFEDDGDGDVMECGWRGSCTCTGNAQSFNLVCSVPASMASCSQRFACTDPFGATGDFTFTLRR